MQKRPPAEATRVAAAAADKPQETAIISNGLFSRSRFPCFCARQSFLPSFAQSRNLGAWHPRLKALLQARHGRNLCRVAPEFHGNPSKICGAELCGFSRRTTNDRDPENVGLKLHQGIIGGATTVDSQLGHRGAGIS